jgi:hypothetical protein
MRGCSTARTWAAGVQRSYAMKAQIHVMFGRNEPGLQHFHRSVEASAARYGG